MLKRYILFSQIWKKYAYLICLKFPLAYSVAINVASNVKYLFSYDMHVLLCHTYDSNRILLH
jgi:uncharacterized membrane protein